jgi:hypothetical protein
LVIIARSHREAIGQLFATAFGGSEQSETVIFWGEFGAFHVKNAVSIPTLR